MKIEGVLTNCNYIGACRYSLLVSNVLSDDTSIAPGAKVTVEWDEDVRRYVDVGSDGKFWYREDRDGYASWNCNCGRDLDITGNKFTTCPGCGRSYMVEYLGVRVIEKLGD